MDASELNNGIKTFIIESLLDGDGADLDDHTPLLELGIIDSLAMVSLLRFIEKKLGVSVPEDEVSPRNFMSIQTLESMILRVHEAQREG